MNEQPLRVELALDHQLLAVESDHHVHAMVELSAPEQAADHDRPPLQIALVLDRSGSMAGAKLEATKRAATFLLSRLRVDDEVAVVTYDDEVDLVCGLAPLGDGSAAGRVEAVDAGGSTNLSGGWLKGVEELERRSDGVRRVLLLTDGLANVGITDPARLVEMARNAADRGATTTTIGFGGDFAEELLTAMADSGRGSAYFAASSEDLPAIFAEEFEGLVTLAAHNVSVEIRPTAAVEVVGVLNDYPLAEVDGGVQILVGDAYAGHRGRVVFRLAVPHLGALGPATVADVVVRWVAVGEQVAVHTVTHPLVVNLVSADEAASAVPDARVVEEVVVLAAAKATDEARRLADEGRFDEAQRVLAAAVGDINRVAERSDNAADLRARAHALEAAGEELSPPAYSSETSKRLHYNSRDLKRRKR